MSEKLLNLSCRNCGGQINVEKRISPPVRNGEIQCPVCRYIHKFTEDDVRRFENINGMEITESAGEEEG